MKNYLKFLAIGTLFSSPVEFTTEVLAKHKAESYFSNLLVVYPVFLTLVFFSSKILDKYFGNGSKRDLAHFCTYAFLGMMIEWCLLGLSPFAMLDQNPIAVLVFQLGMCSYWATVGFAPRLFLGDSEINARTKKWILRFYVPCFAFIFFAVGTTKPDGRLGVAVLLILFCYLFLNIFYFKYFRFVFARDAALSLPDTVWPDVNSPQAV